MEDASLSRANSLHSARLDKTLRELQLRLREQEAALEKLRQNATSTNSATPSQDNSMHNLQLRALTQAHQALTSSPAFLPPVDSPLPALLALRSTHKALREGTECFAAAEAEHELVRAELAREQTELGDARLVAEALDARIARLRGEIDVRSQKTPAELGRDMVKAMEAKRAGYEARTRELQGKFEVFVEETLAGMLAAEEMGGPVVGDMTEVDELVLEAGFGPNGKVKKSRAAAAKGRDADEGLRQRRIDDIWGLRPEGVGVEEEWDEKTAAAREMKELVERLMEKLVEVGAAGGDGYVELARESAASRFLVRSKVAQLHPKDARKLRLVDFGRDLDD